MSIWHACCNPRMKKADILKGIHGVLDSKVVTHNTVRYNTEDRVVLRYTATDIVTFNPKTGIAELSCGLWMTKNTKERINDELVHLGLCASSWGPVVTLDRGKGWIVKSVPGPVFFFNGIRVKKIGDGSGPELGVTNGSKSIRAEKRFKYLQKLVKRYTEKLKKMLQENGPIMPNTGDCWLCAFRNEKTRTPWGDSDPGHFIGHLKTQYVHGSLIVNAFMWAGCPKQLGFYYQMGFDRNPEYINWIVHTVRRYLKAKIGLPYR